MRASTAYRFSLEWSRIEPIRGQFSKAELAHYRRVIDACLDRGITPVVTLQHFTTPQWFAEAGGWSGAEAKDLFSRYVEQACTILDGVEWVATMNEPNMQAAIMTAMKRMEQAGGQWQSPTVEGEYASDEEREQAARNNFLAYADPAISRDVRRDPPRRPRHRPRAHRREGRLDHRRRRTHRGSRRRGEAPRDPLRQGGHLLGRQPR